LSLPRITVITPSFQQGEFIRDTIESVLSQGYENLEYIIIDGGSIDDSVEIIREYEDSLSYWVSEKDSGQSEALNKGLKKATGDIITWLNSDDKLTPGALAQVASEFRPEVGLYFGDTLIKMSNGNSWINKVDLNMLKAQMIGGMPFSQPSCFFNGDIFRTHALRVEDQLHMGMDYYLFLQILCVSEFKYCGAVLSEYLFHPASKSSTMNSRFADEWSLVFKSFIKKIAPEASTHMKFFSPSHIEGELDFPGDPKFSALEIKTGYFFYLYNQIKFRYEDLDLIMTRSILKEIKDRYPQEYKTHSLDKMAWRTFLPRWIVRTFRKKHSS